MLDSISISTILLLGAATALLLTAMLYPSSFLRWLKRKRYQYEVTFSLYMLTPTEKFIFNSGLFLVLSLLIIAACFYLPEHVSTISNRLFYYWFGDEKDQALQSSHKQSVQNMVSTTSNIIREAATQLLGMEKGNGQQGVRSAPLAGLNGNGRGIMEL
ncbi:hypothetical protein GQ43DRAFT_392414 [Delitschia confertaspora ATCC 74209]|uniref:Uncharacterized protein n=1 Tax=Delitschia confertaspora ATCC 74209 TaxID=1513339 RepID=A0A9P4JQ45_9PLEO|nr:hypothetical protein GQ43DRAFT_392414 [Delitschia confertaspora ATCC 74209]